MQFQYASNVVPGAFEEGGMKRSYVGTGISLMVGKLGRFATGALTGRFRWLGIFGVF
jgi:hypothetical protein